MTHGHGTPAAAHLQDVVLGDGGDDPVVGRIPREVGDLAGVAAVDEQQLRRAILRILVGLQGRTYLVMQYLAVSIMLRQQKTTKKKRNA
jgi:hypothetical protein